MIVKIAEIHLTPDKPVYAGESSHIEGTRREQIVATGIYYFGADNITEAREEFRIMVQEPVYAQDDHAGMDAAFGLRNEELCAQVLGTVTTSENRCFFPNTLQHKMYPFQLADPTKPEMLRRLTFFLVGPTKTIPSTSVLPVQQQEWRTMGHISAFQKLATLPADVVDRIRDLTRTGMTLERAKEIRLDLMASRTPERLFGKHSEFVISWCTYH